MQKIGMAKRKGKKMGTVAKNGNGCGNGCGKTILKKSFAVLFKVLILQQKKQFIPN